LKANGLTGRWRDELLAVGDAHGERLGEVERAAARPLGITTHAAHLVGRTPDGDFWVQQRAFDKATDPGLWDTMVGGLVAAGETVATTLARETAEEAGLAVEALQGLEPAGRITIRRPVADGYMVEHIEIFEALVPPPSRPVNRDGEVERFECLAPDALLERLRAGAFTLEAALILVASLERRGLLDR
ncbi:MAG TPA: NUDIX domain-containing protein, partial [Caldimonas sp.]